MDRILIINLYKEQPQGVTKITNAKVNKNVKTFQVKSTKLNNVPEKIKTVKLKYRYYFYKKTANFTIPHVTFENIILKNPEFYMIDCAYQQKCEIQSLPTSYQFNIAQVDRHVLEDEFTVHLSYSLLGNVVLRGKYNLTVSLEVLFKITVINLCNSIDSTFEFRNIFV